MVEEILDLKRGKAKLCAGIKTSREPFSQEERAVEDHREVCLEEEVERRRRAGMSAEEISAEMGVDPAWVVGLISMFPDEDQPDEEGSPTRG